MTMPMDSHLEKTVRVWEYPQQAFFGRGYPLPMLATEFFDRKNGKEENGKGRRAGFPHPAVITVTFTIFHGGLWAARPTLPYIFITSYNPPWSTGVKRASNGILQPITWDYKRC